MNNSSTNLMKHLLQVNLWNAAGNSYVTINPYNQDTKVFDGNHQIINGSILPESSLVIICRPLDFRMNVIDLEDSTDVFNSVREKQRSRKKAVMKLHIILSIYGKINLVEASPLLILCLLGLILAGLFYKNVQEERPLLARTTEAFLGKSSPTNPQVN